MSNIQEEYNELIRNIAISKGIAVPPSHSYCEYQAKHGICGTDCEYNAFCTVRFATSINAKIILKEERESGVTIDLASAILENASNNFDLIAIGIEPVILHEENLDNLTKMMWSVFKQQ